MSELTHSKEIKFKDRRNNHFDTKWWDLFLEKTKSFTETSVFKSGIPKADVALLKKYIKTTLIKLATLRTDNYGLRLFVEGKILEGREMNRFYDSPPHKDESLEQWAARTFKGQKFGFIINEAERFNLDISRFIALKTEPLFNKIGFPKAGLGISLFIGNYGWTPIGIHQDPIGEDVIHFHLGPGSKTMYTWDYEQIKELVDIETYDYRNIEPLIEHSSKFKFSAGDIYFMPTGKHHVGYSGDLSFSATLWRENPTKTRFIKKIHNMIMDQFILPSEGVVS